MREGCWQSVWRDLKSWDPCGSAKHTHQSKFPSQTGFCFHFGILHRLYSLPAVLFCVLTNETMQIITLLIINSWSGGGGFIWCGYCGYNLLLNCQRIFISLVNIISVVYMFMCAVYGAFWFTSVGLFARFLQTKGRKKTEPSQNQSFSSFNISPVFSFQLRRFLLICSYLLNSAVFDFLSRWRDCATLVFEY